jgi:hypothetical protein
LYCLKAALPPNNGFQPTASRARSLIFEAVLCSALAAAEPWPFGGSPSYSVFDQMLNNGTIRAWAYSSSPTHAPRQANKTTDLFSVQDHIMSFKHPERWLVIWWRLFLPIALVLMLLSGYRAYLNGSLLARPPRWEIALLGLSGLLLAFVARRLRAIRPSRARQLLFVAELLSLTFFVLLLVGR